MANQEEVKRLKEKAYELRLKLLHLCGTYEGAVHIGGDLSMSDVLTALWQYGMNVNPDDIRMPTRDRFVLSKGHGAVCMYITMAIRGFWDYDELVETYGKLDSKYGMHPCRVQLPALECSSGSLGQGLAMAVGMALAAKQAGAKNRVFCMMGDGETCEGSIWEAAMTAHAQGLGNLIGIVDRNKQLMTSYSEESMKMEPYADKWRAFGWNTIEVDGHDMAAIVDAIDSIPPVDSDKPTVLVCDTIKGKGVSFMEKVIGWHAGALSDEDYAKAIADLKAAYPEEAAVVGGAE